MKRVTPRTRTRLAQKRPASIPHRIIGEEKIPGGIQGETIPGRREMQMKNRIDTITARGRR
jgi:hypothetical protein